MMRIDEATLTAYLDNELSESERHQLEAQLARSPQAQARLAQLGQEAIQVNEALNLLASPTQTQASLVSSEAPSLSASPTT
jgi:anti-sigma factor RsiW